MTSEIRRAEPSDRAAILAIMRTSLGWPADDRAGALWRWKHEENAFGPSPVWVGTSGGEVVAVRPFLRWQLVTPSGAVVRAVRAVDTATHPDFQGQGWFRRLTLHGLDELAAEGVELVFNTPNDASRPGYLSMGWTEIGRLRAWVALHRWRSAPRLLRSRTAADLWPLPDDIPGSLDPASAFADSDVVERALRHVRRPPAGLTTRTSGPFYAWRYGMAALGYRVVADDPADGFAVVRLRRRGHVRELAVLDVVAPARRRRALVHRAMAAAAPDHAVTIGSRPPGLWWPMPGLGPRLVARAAAGGGSPEALRHGPFRLGLGDVELL